MPRIAVPAANGRTASPVGPAAAIAGIAVLAGSRRSSNASRAEADIAHGGHECFHATQSAAERLGPQPASPACAKNGISSVELEPPSRRGQAADAGPREAKIAPRRDGVVARGRRRLRAGPPRTTPISAGCACAASGAAARRARRPSRRRSEFHRGAFPRQAEAGAGHQSFASASLARGAKHWLPPAMSLRL